jgi:hypothetical protein
MLSRTPWPLAVVALGAAGCRSFVLHEEPVTPEPAPVTRVDVVGADTTYVLRTGDYALLSRDRRLLWARTTIDDAAHRYASLLGARAPAVAVRLDSAPGATPGTWEGMPLITVRATPPDPKRVTPGEEPARELPQVAAHLATVWVRALDVPASAWWFEVGAARLIADPNARVAAVAQASSAGDRTSLGALLGAPRPATDDAVAAVRLEDERPRNVGTSTYGGYGAYGASGTEPRPERLPSYRGPLAPSQAAALLLFLRDRDPAFVAELPARLRAGATLPELLAKSESLPHTVDAFDVAWRKWLKARSNGRALSASEAARAR